MGNIDEQIAHCAEEEHIRRTLGDTAHALIERGDYETALEISDALILIPRISLNVLCNALWVVQPDNTGLELNESMARRFLAATVFKAKWNPPMHLNAAAVYAHFDDIEPVVRHLLLAKSHDFDLSPYLDEPLFDPARKHPRWPELTGQLGPVEEITWMEVALEACERGEFANAFPALFSCWSKSKSPRVADLIDVLSERAGERVGYVGERLESALRDAPETLFAALDADAKTGVKREPNAEEDDDDDWSNLIWLSYRANDPRFASAIVPMLCSPPPMAPLKVIEDGWRELMTNLEALRDVRLIEPLETLSLHIDALIPNPIGAGLKDEFKRVAQALREFPVPGLCAEEEACCEKLESMLGPRKDNPFRVSVETPAREEVPVVVDPLLRLWRETRDPRVADLLDLQRERTGDVPDLAQQIRDEIIPSDDSECDVGAFAATQLIWDAKQSNDPRVTHALIQIFEDPPFIIAMRDENGVTNFWNEVMEVCVALGDVRVVGPMRALSARVSALAVDADAEAEQDMYTAHPPGPYLRHQLSKHADEVESKTKPTALNKEQAALFEDAWREYEPERVEKERLRAIADARVQEHERLLQEIVNDLANDAPRLAYAEFLGDDPYAEFIQLQIARAKGETGDVIREVELQNEYGHRWTGHFAHMMRDVVFERGFIVSCGLEVDPFRNILEERHIGDRIWATVRSLRTSDDYGWSSYDLDNEDDDAPRVQNEMMLALVRDDMMKSLVELDGVSGPGLIALVDGGHQHYELVTLEPYYIQPQWWPDVLAALKKLPELRTVRVRHTYDEDSDEIASLFDPALGIEHLDIVMNTRSTLQDIVFESLAATSFQRVTFSFDEHTDDGFDRFELALVRDANDVFSHVEATQFARRVHSEEDDEELQTETTQFWTEPFLELIARIPADDISSFSLVQGRGVSALPTRENLDLLSAALETFPHLEQIDLLPAADSPEQIAELIGQLEDPVRSTMAFKKLGAFQNQTARPALARYAVEGATQSARRLAIDALASIADASVVPQLIAALDTTHAGWMACNLLGYLQAREAVPDLVAYTKKLESEYYREEVAKTFARLDSDDAVPALLTLYAEQPSNTILGALARLGAKEARQLALAALASGDDDAIVSLGFVGQPEDRELFEKRVENNTYVIYTAGIPLLATIMIAPQEATNSQLDELSAVIEKWGQGISEECAWMVLELAHRLPTGDSWSSLGSAIVAWAEQCLAWSRRTRKSGDLAAAHWIYWETICSSVVDAWSGS